ncbi:MAG: sulfatase-like hydrolase/transferase [Fimbriimonadaceae bacterium]|nr:sulfatase-like hydrolase/transferase [Chitinophagales bacterium]
MRLNAQCSLPAPTGFTVFTASCNATLSWNPVSTADHYFLQYKSPSDPIPFLIPLDDEITTFTISGLTPNTLYKFVIRAGCEDSRSLNKAYLHKKTSLCSEPLNPFVTAVDTVSAIIAWTPQCGSNIFNLQYRKQGTTTWSQITNIVGSTKKITSLESETIYQFRMQTVCSSTLNSDFTETSTFTTSSTRPNIIFIMVDDGRYDSYIPNGGPSWFNTQNINRIADEGVNFRIACAPTPLCAPSRAMIYTGLLPHKNGCTANGTLYDTSLLMVQEVFQDNDYYTGFVGKYGQSFPDPKGFDWWVTSNNDEYINPPYTKNGVDTSIAGNILDSYPSLVNEFLNTVPEGKPYMLMLFHRAPHYDATPRAEEAGMFSLDSIALPENFNQKYDDDYPSIFYTSSFEWNLDIDETKDWKLREYQCLKGVDDNIGEIFDRLEMEGTLDNTMIIYTSDNGYLEGEHKLAKKGLGLDESLRLPMFIRYPKWFNDSTIIDDQIASLADVNITMLEAAGIENTFGFDGLSLKDLYKGDTTRNEFFYELGVAAVIPAIRGVRTFDYLYTEYSCTSETRELYDLAIDSKQNINQINNPDYASIAEFMHTKLDSLRTLNDDIEPDLFSCYLVNDYLKSSGGTQDGTEFFDNNSLSISPNPIISDNAQLLYNNKGVDANIAVYDITGQELYKTKFSGSDVPQKIEINTSAWSIGVYIVCLYNDKDIIIRELSIVK